MLKLQDINEILSGITNKQHILDNDTINLCISNLTQYMKNGNISNDENELLNNIVGISQKI